MAGTLANVIAIPKSFVALVATRCTLDVASIAAYSLLQHDQIISRSRLPAFVDG
jgi:hypothetical protein